MRKSTKLALMLFLFAGLQLQAEAQEIPDSNIINTESGAPEAGVNTDMPLEEGEDDEVVAAEDLADTSLAVVDGYMNLNTFKKAKPMPLPEINPNNVKFYKRIWRDIDMKDSTNANIFFLADGSSFTELIVDAIKKGKIIAYDPRPTKKNPTGDGFKAKYTATQAMSRLVDSVLVPQLDENGNQIGSTMQLNEFNPENITKYRIKEDIFYDKQRARYETRIVGLAPLKKIDAGGEELTEVSFWLYFPHIRKVLVTKECKDNLTYDDIFIQHNFASNIIRDSKQPNQKIEDPALVEKQIREHKEKSWKY